MADEITNQDMLSAFSEMQNKNEMAQVLKELFEDKKIFMISDLTRDEIKLATRIYTIAELKNIGAWKTGLMFYCQLLLSKDRKSRKEVLEAIRGYAQQNLMQKINPFGRK